MHSGDTVLIPAPGTGIVPHLWIVVTEPAHDTHICVIVNITTLRNSQDQTVALNAGDHPFINHPSSVRYSDAQLADEQRLLADIAAGTARHHRPCSPKLLRLVQDGMLASPFTPKKIERFCREHWRERGR
ncbi:MAG: hypothetical protein ABSG65_22225 [Bryobacteraceae bacterium]|jgi:hypothetical protein